MLKDHGIKVDDVLLYLLKEYHGVTASEALSFFTDRVSEMKQLEPNITDKSRPSTIQFRALDKRTVQTRWTNNNTMRRTNPYHDPRAKYYVLRGFYPDTNLPFKMVVVRAGTGDGYGIREQGDVLHCKVVMGMKPHFSTFNSGEVNRYKEGVSEAILLDEPTDNVKEVRYTYRNFKCMRPKGMELYRERNYEEKQKEKKRIAAKKRRDAKTWRERNKSDS